MWKLLWRHFENLPRTALRLCTPPMYRTWIGIHFRFSCYRHVFGNDMTSQRIQSKNMRARRHTHTHIQTTMGAVVLIHFHSFGRSVQFKLYGMSNINFFLYISCLLCERVSVCVHVCIELNERNKNRICPHGQFECSILTGLLNFSFHRCKACHYLKK